MNVAFLPNSSDFMHPQDRRRYVPFMRDFGIKREIAKFDVHYDVLYVSLNCDLNLWSKYKSLHDNKKTRIIFDLSDNYLKAGTISSCVRSIVHFGSGKTRQLNFDYRSSIKKMLSCADVVTVGSEEQKQYLSKYHDEIIVVRDYFKPEIKEVVDPTYTVSDNELNIFWEGFSHGSKSIFKGIKKLISPLRGNYSKIRLHVVTDAKYCKIMGKYLCRGTLSILQNLFNDIGVEVCFYPWSVSNLNLAAARSSLAIIWLPNDEFMRSKPENKLLLCWSLGLPTIASDSGSYERVMRVSGNSSCLLKNDLHDKQKMIDFCLNEKYRRKNLLLGREYISKELSYSRLFQVWHEVFFGK